jgi:gamma-glutamyltranspeptidase
MFLDAQGEPDAGKSRDGGLAVGVPGTVAGLALAARKYGSHKFTLAQLIEPAIKLAADGFDVDDDTADTLPRAAERLSRWPSSAKIFTSNGRMLQQGERLVQSDLAATLRAVAQSGPRAFYEGAIAEKIAAAVREAGGIMTAEDLRAYRPLERAVLRGSYRGFDVIAMPPPSSGGVCLIDMLNILEGYDLAKTDRVEALHLEIEAPRLCGPRGLHGRSCCSENANRAADVQILRRAAAQEHRPARDSVGGHPPRPCRGPRRSQHDALLRHRPRRQRGVQHLHAQFQLRHGARRRRHGRAAQ